jgi:DNA invertase Pin-like site-specific DNA recombinase
MSGQRTGQMKGHRIGYKRVSTLEQSTARQLDGIAVDKMFEDHASGKDTKRPQLQLALSFLREGDTLVVHSMDRLSRSLTDLLSMVKELTGKGVAVEFVKENMTFTGDDSPMSVLMLSLLGSVSQFERAILLERQREGIAIAKQAGAYKGKKKTLTRAKQQELKARADAGENRVKLAKELGISRQSLYNYLSYAEPAISA